MWPVENATIALGFKRYGLDQHVERLITGMFEAAARFRHLDVDAGARAWPHGGGVADGARRGCLNNER